VEHPRWQKRRGSGLCGTVRIRTSFQTSVSLVYSHSVLPDAAAGPAPMVPVPQVPVSHAR
jgi:hypothetical protein